MTPKPALPSDSAILDALRDSPRGPLKTKELARALDVETAEYKAFKRRLSQLENEGRVYRVKGRRYAIPEKINLTTGRLSKIRSGDAFVSPGRGSPRDQDVFVPASLMESAMDGDEVVVRIEDRPKGKNPVGRVIKVLERAHPTVVGRFQTRRNFGTVVPSDPKVNQEVLISPGDEGGAREGDVVVVRMTQFGTQRLSPMGVVEKILGKSGDPGVDILTILFGHGLTDDFPGEVARSARELAERKGADGGERTDLRELNIFTIDPADAKDHDDALSVRQISDGVYEVGVHIADVSWFVEPGSPVDVEAQDRGTSVYLVDRTIPMLPHVLSNDVCSLKPHEDRFTVSAFIELDLDGKVRQYRFERGLIRSKHKLAYEEVQEVLEGERSIDEKTDEDIRTLDRIARGVRRRRLDRGSIDFDLPEARVILGPDGAPVDIQRVARLDAHRLIEDFMILANEVVARETERRKFPSFYRIHEPPTEQKTEDLREFVKTFGFSLPRKRTLRPKDLQSILEKLEGRPEEGLVSKVMLRSMNRAVYSTENLGHFGLAADWYTHFTSPIRRYPDLVVHRTVVRGLVEGRPVPEQWGGEGLERLAERCSEREQAATQAERDSIDLKKVEYMECYLGDDFWGTISGVTSFGCFVLLDEVFVDGLIHVNAMEDDYYRFEAEAHALVGERKGRRFRLGDRVHVRVSRTDREERKVDFVLLEGPFPPGKGGSGQTSPV